MTDHRHSSADEKRLHRWIESLPDEPADPEFRRRLQAQFLERSASRTHRIRNGVLAVVAIAAALLIMLWWFDRGPDWEVVVPEGGVAEDIRFELDDDSWTAAELIASGSPPATGALLTTHDDSELQLQAGEQMLWVITPGAQLVLPEAAGRWFGRVVHTEVLAGELRVTTLADFPGTRLVIANDITRIELTGSTIAVIQAADSTCLCVLEGAVTMLDRDAADPVIVPSGQRRLVHRDGRVEVAPLESGERMKLEMLRDQVNPADEP